jgi:hypothetical protein
MPNDAVSNTITEVTRRAITDYLLLGCAWSGAFNERDFLARLHNLKEMHSTDGRREYPNAWADIYQHRVRNPEDWPDDWVFHDDRFNLLYGPDEPFLKFLCETVHPIVRPDSEEARKMVDEFNSQLAGDGWELHPTKEISGKPVFGFRQLTDSSRRHLEQAKAVAERLTGQYVEQQIRRMEEAVDNDPELAIGTAKEFLETLCKTILTERGVNFPKDENLPALVKTTIKNLKLVPDSVSVIGPTERTITILLNNLGSIGHHLAELRNLYGTGHGKITHHVGLEKRHAKLAVGAAATLAGFLFDSHEADDESKAHGRRG